MPRLTYSQRMRKAKGSQAHDRYQDARRNLSADKATARDIRKTAAWRAFSKWYRTKYPLCCDPFKAHGKRPVAAMDVHHVKPCGANPELAFDESNCRSLCRGCHASVSAIERKGEDAEGLFR